ncbi:hypothetical protein QK290_05935 [Pseudarthrobacter sp. AL07]|uniref:hypothetical protein n=1 Tax=unclassified Pseudarthrobacter TaxID=2647000 RepID=UPI00249B0173|nr:MULTISPECIES: hypothetical protein [unclassified Pseudarthrobacter]MDI3193973.1 hypothetical protein [Pseudarthrobacter sp. AL20]MDI3208066.1 hypothetical protein [Pseudarthrobacter sp. AL07]
MKSKLLLGIGIAAGYVLGSRSGRAAYDKLKARATSIWDSKPVQDKVSAATEAIKEKAPDVADQLGEAARRAGTVISSAVHHEAASGITKSKTSDAGTSAGESMNLGTSDVESDPAFNDNEGQDWSGEGGATTAGAATNVDPRRE